ncbi:PEP-CTERM sorting domain-containing protein [Nostoc sp.]|uniref:PEP-CTERM sorting domain-containing protein n=1 Tax=Nostoc sp. TaxID=1180 RepID=UPI002FFCD095
MKSLIRTLAVGVIAASCYVGQAYADTIISPLDKSVPRTHAHNDYENEYPLFDALHNGFISVEADIWLYGTQLRVAHDPVSNPTTLPTIEDLYLTPLQDLAAQVNNGGIYADGTPLLLLVDIKSEDVSTYERLHNVLTNYAVDNPGLFTTYTKNASGGYDTQKGAVNVIISGNRPRDYMLSQDLRYAAYDGRADDIGKGIAPEFIPLISGNWNTFFNGDLAWDGLGTIPDDTKAALDDIVAQIHGENKILRFWNLPIDAPSVWGPLYDANVDLINTDNLASLSTYIQSRQTQAVPEPSLSIALLAVLGTSLLLKRRPQPQSVIDHQS